MAHALYAGVMLRRRASMPWSGLAIITVAMGAGIGPLVGALVTLWGQRTVLSLPGEATLPAYLALILPPLLSASLILGARLPLASRYPSTSSRWRYARGSGCCCGRGSSYLP